MEKSPSTLWNYYFEDISKHIYVEQNALHAVVVSRGGDPGGQGGTRPPQFV